MALVAMLASASALAQNECTPVPAHDPTPAEVAYKAAKYESADSLYVEALAQKPGDPELTAALIHTQLHEGRLADASSRVNKALAEAPHSAALLTALAELQYRQGQPWLAAQTVESAFVADPCYARAHFIRSRILRMDSMYASERAELDKAYQIDPSDPDIWHAWLAVVKPADEIQHIEEALATTDIDADTRQKAQASAASMLSLVAESSQTCQDAAIAAPVTIPLTASYANVKEISSYRLRVELPKSNVRLVVDTAGSGLYLSRATAELNGFEHQDQDPPGTVRVQSLHIGPLEFKDCLVGVSDAPFADGGEGFIGTDVFARYLTTLNFPDSKLELAPLPLRASDAKTHLPGDRLSAAEMPGFAPVFHKRQYLMVPVLLNKKERRLFILDTGIRLTTMTSPTAHAVSNTRVNFTNTIKTVSGASLQMYRDTFDLEFANLSLDRQGQILEFDPTAIAENTGIAVGGMLGFNILHSLAIHMDYRDGLIKFDSPASGPARMSVASSSGTPASPSPATEENTACDQYAGQNGEQSIDSTLEGQFTGVIDSGHLKPGQVVTMRVFRDWISPICALTQGATLYGHVLAASSSSRPNPAKLAIVFDHGDCSGHPKQELSLRLIAVAGGDPAYRGEHEAMPTEIAGGGRAIGVTVARMGRSVDDNMSPEFAPKTVHPGVVAGIPHLKLTPEGGPRCSALMTSEEHSVHLSAGTEFILTMQSLR